MYYRDLGAVYQATPGGGPTGTARIEQEFVNAGVPPELVSEAMRLWSLWNEKARDTSNLFGSLKYRAWRAKPEAERIAAIVKEVQKKAGSLPGLPVLPGETPPSPGLFGMSTNTLLLIGVGAVALILLTSKKEASRE